jgi:hypothetical protein
VLVGVGNGLRRIVSYDGHTWTGDVWSPDPSISDQNEHSHRDVAIARGIIVAVGDGGIFTSTDGGGTFTNVDTTRLHGSIVASFRGAFWIVSTAGTLQSTDGTSWTGWRDSTVLPGGGNLPAIYEPSSYVVTDSTLYVFGGNGTYRTFDGTTWAERTIPGAGGLGSSALGAGRFVVVSNGACCGQPNAGLRAASTNGVDWTVASDTSGNDDVRFGDVLFDGAKFFATASQYDNRTFSSTDGISWTATQINVGLGSLVRIDGVWVGTNNADLYASTDAVAWTKTHTATGDAGWGFTQLTVGKVLK